MFRRRTLHLLDKFRRHTARATRKAIREIKLELLLSPVLQLGIHKARSSPRGSTEMKLGGKGVSGDAGSETKLQL